MGDGDNKYLSYYHFFHIDQNSTENDRQNNF